MPTLSERVNDAFAKEDWTHARQLLVAELARAPDDHWLHSRLSATYYEERNYQEAYRHIKKAYALAPDCPLVLWDLAGTLFALGKVREAARIYRTLIHKRPQMLANEPHGEGLEWALSLLIDCLFRSGMCFQALGKRASALKCYRSFIEMRAQWSGGIYTIEDAAKQLAKFEKPTADAVEREIRRAQELLAV
jgi:tetratricopeptide (TPR) repeat protein